MHGPSREQLVRENALPSPLHNDCSGKHTFMLGACRARGWDEASYLSPDHALQQRVIAHCRAFTATRPALAVDGCGLPTLWLSLAGMARAWSMLAVAMQDPDEDPLLARIGWAMAHHPELTSGTGRLDLALARRAQEPWVGKIGALGVFCIALPERGLGLAFKVVSGCEDALAVAVSTVVDRLLHGVLAPPGPGWAHGHVRNVVGKVVGRRVVAGRIGVY